MVYVSLYRKYRPQTFREILGQDHVSRTLANAIEEDRVAHAYLFTGPRGTGKTSTARILAKALNCDKGPTADPCGVCNSCVAIAEGSSMDVIELDAASHSKVEETRDVLTGVPLATAGGRKKVYVIDEVHMLTTQSFNALLKTLEEPPGHVIFVLATTEAHKVLPTIVSRTQRFDFRRVSADVIEAHLADVAKREGIDAEPDALTALARHAEGSVRDALSALDQLGSIGGSISEEDAERLLGERREDALIQLFDAISSGDVGSIFTIVHSQIAEGADPRQFALSVMGHARSLLLLATSPDSAHLLDITDEDRGTLALQAERFSPGTLLRALDLVAKAVTDMRTAPNHRLLLEVALVRTAAPETDPGASGLLGRIERLERRFGIEGAPDEAPSERPPEAAPSGRTPEAAPSGRTPAPSRPSKAPAKAGPLLRDASSAGTRPSTPATSTKPAASEEKVEPEAPVAPARPVSAEHVGLSHVKDAWAATIKEVNSRSRRVGAFLNPSRPTKLDGDKLVVEVQSVFHRDAMSEDRNRSALADAIYASLGVRFAVAFVERGADPEAAVEQPATEDQSSSELVAEGEEEAVVDPVELVKKGLAAEVVEDIEER